MKGMKSLIEWLVEKMTLLAQSGQQKTLQTDTCNNKSSVGGSEIIGKIEINEEETLQLQ